VEPGKFALLSSFNLRKRKGKKERKKGKEKIRRRHALFFPSLLRSSFPSGKKKEGKEGKWEKEESWHGREGVWRSLFS